MWEQNSARTYANSQVVSIDPFWCVCVCVFPRSFSFSSSHLYGARETGALCRFVLTFYNSGRTRKRKREKERKKLPGMVNNRHRTGTCAADTCFTRLKVLGSPMIFLHSQAPDILLLRGSGSSPWERSRARAINPATTRSLPITWRVEGGLIIASVINTALLNLHARPK